MARMPRLAVAGLPHLVVQRRMGQPAFFDDVDRQLYTQALRDVVASGDVSIHAYCLTDESVLLLASPGRPDDLGRLMQRVNRRYVPAHHSRHGVAGPLWTGRFQATAVEPEQYLLRCMLMIEQAPVRAGLAARAVDWSWSSARHHAGQGPSALVSEQAAWWATGNTPFEREARHEVELQRPLRDEQVAELLTAARGGWPLGSAAFVAGVADHSNRPVRPRPRGRPRRPDALGS